MRSQCTVPNCLLPVNANGLCGRHYSRVKKYGRLALLPRYTPAERFDQHTNRFGPLPTSHPEFGNCWLTTFATDGGGYGVFKVGRVMTKTHRYALEQALKCPIPDGMMALHTCDNRRCVRNDTPGIYELNGATYPRWGHLWLGTQLDNAQDMTAKGRGRTGERNGHATMPERTPRGQTAGRALLNDADVLTIRARWSNGETAVSLAREYGVNSSTIDAIVHRHNWKHL